MAPQVHQLRKLHTYVPLYLAALSPRTGLVPARLQPPPSTLHPHSLCLHCSVDRPPPTDYLATNHAPGSPSKENCLDVACNHGSISTQLAFDFAPAKVVAVDIDPDLVRKAEHLYALKPSRLRPLSVPSARPVQVDYYPMSPVLTHGRLPPAAEHARNWPAVQFIAADWLVSTDPALAAPYHVILVLSVIKWIHLQHLDEGLVSFFRKCNTSLAPAGYLVLEAQSWDSYQKAVRPNAAPHLAQNLKTLKSRPETSFTELLQNEGLNLCAASDELPRPITIYRKASKCGVKGGSTSAIV